MFLNNKIRKNPNKMTSRIDGIIFPKGLLNMNRMEEKNNNEKTKIYNDSNNTIAL